MVFCPNCILKFHFQCQLVLQMRGYSCIINLANIKMVLAVVGEPKELCVLQFNIEKNYGNIFCLSWCKRILISSFSTSQTTISMVSVYNIFFCCIQVFRKYMYKSQNVYQLPFNMSIMVVLEVNFKIVFQNFDSTRLKQNHYCKIVLGRMKLPTLLLPL